MRLFVRALLSASVVAVSVAGVAPAHAADPMALTDLGPSFLPPAGVAADSVMSAAGKVMVVNASSATRTYALVDLVSNARTLATISPGQSHTYSNLTATHTYSIDNGFTARALVAAVS